LMSKILLTGQLPIDQLAKCLALSDIGVSPYCGRVEYSGLKLLDYKAAGLPVIASGIDGQPSVIEHGRTGLIVPPCDEDALCEALILLATNPIFRFSMGREARIDAEQHHCWRHTAKQLEWMIEKVILS